MRNRFGIPFLVCGLILISLSYSHAQMLDKYLWENRVIIINELNSDYKTADLQQATLLKHKQQLNERKLVILRYDGQEISQAYPDSHSNFANQALSIKVAEEDRLLLIGLDGGIKLRRNAVVDPQYVFDLIDSMPMRQSEIRRKKKKQ